MNTTIAILIAVVAAIVAALVTYFAAKAGAAKKLAAKNEADAVKMAQMESELKAAKEMAESELKAAKERIEEEKKRVEEAKEEGKKRLEEDRERQKEVLEATKVALQAENDKTLKLREESLKKEAEETIKNVTSGLNQEIKKMSEAFEAQKQSHVEGLASMRTQLDETVRNLGAQSEKIGNKADKLADALRHDNKMQGNWGEMQLQNIFDQEGMVLGRDYEREEYLRDEQGNIISNGDTGKRMRPDFILHFPDSTDVIVDSKMNIDAYVDWVNAEDDETREDAAKRNLAALKAQIKTLTDKRYNEHMSDGHRTLPYVIMYVSNYGALALARKLERNIENEAFNQNVCIATEETMMPLLRLIHTAWVSVDQVRNQEKIVKAAAQMVERVSDLVTANKAVGDALKKAVEAHDKCSAKLSESGQSITVAARNVIKLGVPVNPKKGKALGLDEEQGLLPELPEAELEADEQSAE